MRSGYGKFNRSGGPELAHRVAWEMKHGPIPAGLDVLHKCDNPPCVADEHLFLGTNADNVADCCAKGRQAQGDSHGSRLYPERLPHGDRHWTRLHPESRLRGDANGSAKLTEEKVKRIFQLRREGWTQARLAAEFCVCRSNIGLILTRKQWAQVSADDLAP